MCVPLTWQEWHAIAESRGQTIDRLARENAELRELVRDMADAIVDWYDLIDGAFACESVYGDEKFAPLFDRMRELGVEV